MSNFVVMGIADTYSSTSSLVTSKIFYTDLREANKINYFETELLRKYSLSCNQVNSNEFVLTTQLNAKIYDIRQTKPLYQIYEVDHSGKRERYSAEVHASWSPNGKYIFTISYLANTFFFWDVRNAERIPISTDITRIMDGRRWYSNEGTWINDYLVVPTRDDIYALAPQARTMKHISHYENTYGLDFAYNEKTLQLAAYIDEGICIWSHYKLPQYQMQQSQ